MKKDTSARLSGTAALALDILLALVLLGALWGFYNGFVFSRVQGGDMFPTYRSTDFLLCKKVKSYERGDILFFRGSPEMLTYQEKDTSIRRVVGLPGETVELYPDGTVTVDGRTVEEPYLEEAAKRATYRENGITALTLGEDEYFVLGDERASALDSRDYGPVKASAALGRALDEPNMVEFLLTLILPLCIALGLWCLGDHFLTKMRRS